MRVTINESFGMICLWVFLSLWDIDEMIKDHTKGLMTVLHFSCWLYESQRVCECTCVRVYTVRKCAALNNIYRRPCFSDEHFCVNLNIFIFFQEKKIYLFIYKKSQESIKRFMPSLENLERFVRSTFTNFAISTTCKLNSIRKQRWPTRSQFEVALSKTALLLPNSRLLKRILRGKWVDQTICKELQPKKPLCAIIHALKSLKNSQCIHLAK